MRKNNTFVRANPTKFNATTGRNGSFQDNDNPRSNIFYAIGFETAALEIINIALNSSNNNDIDCLVYPICFNMRHAIELRLKKLWLDLEILSRFRWEALQEHRKTKLAQNSNLKKTEIAPFPKIKALQYHDIGVLWKNISEYAPVIDSRFKDIIDILSEFIQDIADIDPTGQTFRYPSDNESKTHLLETPLININILNFRFSNLRSGMNYLDELSNNLINEYSSLREFNIDKEQYKKDTRISHTKKLSYFNIIEITYNMSRFIEEGNYRSKSSKEYIKNNFNLSSNEYGKVINIIENDFFINNILNLENKLIYL
ncbi:TPA: hypothetical protein QHO58_002648, partial [Proteus mirabilis]|nr:hypothetical protein [Proteus mirabilis]